MGLLSCTPCAHRGVLPLPTQRPVQLEVHGSQPPPPPYSRGEPGGCCVRTDTRLDRCTHTDTHITPLLGRCPRAKDLRAGQFSSCHVEVCPQSAPAQVGGQLHPHGRVSTTLFTELADCGEGQMWQPGSETDTLLVPTCSPGEPMVPCPPLGPCGVNITSARVSVLGQRSPGPCPSRVSAFSPPPNPTTAELCLLQSPPGGSGAELSTHQVCGALGELTHLTLWNLVPRARGGGGRGCAQ